MMKFRKNSGSASGRTGERSGTRDIVKKTWQKSVTGKTWETKKSVRDVRFSSLADKTEASCTYVTHHN